MIEEIKIQDLGTKSPYNFEEIFNNSIVNFDEELKPQPIAISIGETLYKGNPFPIPFGTYGNFSCIAGPPKSTKSFLKSLILACCIGGNSNLHADQIRGHNIGKKFIIDIDTEQSEYHAQKVFRRTLEISGGMPDNYVAFSLREYSPEERRAFIKWLIYESKYKNNIAILSIDGIADLINNVNDIEDSNEVLGELLKWTKETNIHIITVLHVNFGTFKLTGHLGSAMEKKAETICLVQKDEFYYKAVPQTCRNKPFDQFYYEINDNNWLPYVVDQTITKY
jgi:hypothetical protein